MPDLVIAGERFACREHMPGLRLMELASAVSSTDQTRRMAGMYDFALAVVQPEERERFIEAIHALDDDEDAVRKFNEAIGELMVSYSDRPTERPSNSPTGAAPTGRSSRVVSLSRGTVKTDEESSMDGASTGS